MVHFLYSLIDIFCLIIITIIYSQNGKEGFKQKYFRIYLIVLFLFCFVDGFWGIVASHSLSIVDSIFFLKFSSTLFYFFSAFTAFSWLIYMIFYSELNKKIKHKELIYPILLLPVAVLVGMLIINWNEGIIFSHTSEGEYRRGIDKYVMITYILLYSYYFVAFFISAFITLNLKHKKNKELQHFKTAVVSFTLVPIVGGILQFQHPDYPYHAMGFTLSAFIIFIFEIIEEREKVANENLRAHQKIVLDRCSEIVGNNYSVDINISSLLQLVGEYCNSERVFILEFNKDADLVDCTYEWCKNSVEAQIEDLKNIPIKSLDYWMNRYKKGEEEMLVDVEDIKDEDPNLYKMCKIHNTNVVMNVVLKSGGKLFGFIGIDNPEKTTENYRIIRTVSIYIYSEILRRNNNIIEQKTNTAVLTALAEDYSSVYYIDSIKDELHPYRYNSQMKKHFEKLYNQGISYSKAYEIYVNEVVYSEDVSEMIEFGTIENLTKKLKYRKTVRKQYRCTINGKIEYFQAKWVKADEMDDPLTAFILGFTSIDEQVRNNEIINLQKNTIEKQKSELSDAQEKITTAKLNGQIDRLTGLYNKIYGQHLIEEYITLKDIDDYYVLMFIDIDHFKGFNDCYGHLVGDEVLIAVGDAIKSICRSDDIAVRFGGDEFVVLFKKVGDKKIAMSKAISLRNNLQQYSLDKTYNLTCSIGITISNSIDINEVLNQADKVLYEVKNTTRDDVKIYQSKEDSFKKVVDNLVQEVVKEKAKNLSKKKKK